MPEGYNKKNWMCIKKTERKTSCIKKTNSYKYCTVIYRYYCYEFYILTFSGEICIHTGIDGPNIQPYN